MKTSHLDQIVNKLKKNVSDLSASYTVSVFDTYTLLG